MSRRHFNHREEDDFTIVKNPGKENMEIITKEGEKINRYKPSDSEGKTEKKGKKIGIAYELENGEIIKRNVPAIQNGKNDCKLNQLGKNNGLDIIGSTKDNTKWNQIILPHDKIDTFISAHTPTEKYEEWMKRA